MSQFGQIKDSGKRQEFDTGAVRDTQDDKPRYDLIPPTALQRVAMHYASGAKKYDPWNWERGMEHSRFYASMFRHMQQFALGDIDEDHLAAIVFNALSIMHFQDTGRTHLDDMMTRMPSNKEKHENQKN